MVMSTPFAGALIKTFFAPALRCFSAPSLSAKNPVLSTTTSILKSFHGSFSGSFSANTLMNFPSTTMPSGLASTAYLDLPCTESYFRRCASVFVSVRSFTATHSIFSSWIPAWRTCLPMRPKPLIATRIIIPTPLMTDKEIIQNDIYKYC